MVGKFGKAGKLPERVRNSECHRLPQCNTLYVGEIGNLRVQKLMLH